MDAKGIASKITEAGSAKVEQQKPPAIDEAVVNKVIKQGATALSSGVSKGEVDPAVGAAAEVGDMTCMHAAKVHFAFASCCLSAKKDCALSLTL